MSFWAVFALVFISYIPTVVSILCTQIGGYEQAGYCYRVFNMKVKSLEALESCKIDFHPRSELATIPDLVTNNWILNSLLSDDYPYFWIGLERWQNVNVPEWTDGYPTVQNNFDLWFPDSYWHFRTGVMYSNGCQASFTPGAWDFRCYVYSSHAAPYVCSVPMCAGEVCESDNPWTHIRYIDDTTTTQGPRSVYCNPGDSCPPKYTYSCHGVTSTNTNVCSGRSECINNNQCRLCPFPYEGSPDCSALTSCNGYDYNDPDVCTGRGNCTAMNTCECEDVYVGSWCEQDRKCFGIKYDNPSVCSGHGECIRNNTCECDSRHIGQECKDLFACDGILHDNSSVCNGRGECVRHNWCECGFGYIPPYCESCGLVATMQGWEDSFYGLQYNDKCFVSYNTMMWNLVDFENTANLFCEIGGVLSFADEDEFRFVMNAGWQIFQSSNLAFIGLNNVSGEFEWHDGMDITNSYMLPFDHSISTGGECYVIDQYDNSSYFSVSCTSLHQSVCVLDLSNKDNSWYNVKYDVANHRGYCDKTGFPCPDKYRTCGPNLTMWNDPNVCFGNGRCHLQSTCECFDGYSGNLCTKISCFGVLQNDTFNVCSGHGNCNEADICDCDKGYYGIDCNVTKCGKRYSNDTQACTNRGTCHHSGCKCNSPYFGNLCQYFRCFEIENNNSVVCANHGICQDIDDCECVDFYTGEECESFDFLNSTMIVSYSLGALFIVLLILFCVLLFVIGCCCYAKWMKRRLLQGVDEEDLALLKMDKNESEAATLKFTLNQDIFEIQWEELKLISKVGEGGSGSQIMKSQYKSNLVAFKIFHILNVFGEPNKSDFDCIEREITMMASLNQFFGGITIKTFSKPKNQACYRPPRVGIVTEFCSEGDLEMYLRGNPRTLPFNKKVMIMEGISDAMSYISDRDVIHRDLKPQNILLTDSLVPKLADFGLSRMIKTRKSHLTKRVGTSRYMAPELVLGRHYDGSVDVYSFGISMWEVFQESFQPYKTLLDNSDGTSGSDSMVSGIVENRVANDPSFRPPLPNVLMKTTEGDYFNLMTKCWVHDALQRPSWSEIYKTLDDICRNKNNESDLRPSRAPPNVPPTQRRNSSRPGRAPPTPRGPPTQQRSSSNTKRISMY